MCVYLGVLEPATTPASAAAPAATTLLAVMLQAIALKGVYSAGPANIEAVVSC